MTSGRLRWDSHRVQMGTKYLRVNMLNSSPSLKSWGKRSGLHMPGVKAPWSDLKEVSFMPEGLFESVWQRQRETPDPSTALIRLNELSHGVMHAFPLRGETIKTRSIYVTSRAFHLRFGGNKAPFREYIF